MLSKSSQVSPDARWSWRGVKIPTDLKVGGSSPSERAQLSGQLLSCDWSDKTLVQQQVQQPEFRS